MNIFALMTVEQLPILIMMITNAYLLVVINIYPNQPINVTLHVLPLYTQSTMNIFALMTAIPIIFYISIITNVYRIAVIIFYMNQNIDATPHVFIFICY